MDLLCIVAQASVSHELGYGSIIKNHNPLVLTDIVTPEDTHVNFMTSNKDSDLINTYFMKQSDLYYFEAIKMTSQT